MPTVERLAAGTGHASARAKATKGWLWFAAAAVGVCAAAGLAAERPPNFVFILTDDQGWFDVGIHGNPVIQTPVLDELARDGVRFSQFYAAPVCTPTRAGLMTGRCFPRTGAIDTYMGRDVLAASEVTLPSLLQKQGYRTGCFGKWHLGRYAKYHPNARGFDEFFGFWQYGFINRYLDSDELFHNRARVATTGYITDVLTDAAIAFLRANRDRPFFLYLPYNAPHDPHLVPDSYLAEYLRKGVPLADARVYGMVTAIDDNVGRLLKALDEAGLRERTVVVFMTDNGGVTHFQKCGLRGNKGSVYEGGIRVPLFVRWPGHFPAGAVVSAMAQYVDLFPTFCDLAGAPLPADRKLDGKSLLPLLRNGGGPGSHQFICQQWCRVAPNPDTNWMIRDASYKLVNGELYDLNRDPGETTNLAPQHPALVQQLRAQFQQWFADVTGGMDYSQRVPIEVGREDENPVELDVTWATPVGRKIRPAYRRYIRDSVEQWSQVGDAVRWSIEVVRAGNYEVTLDYGCRPADAGGRFAVSAGAQRLVGAVEATIARDVFRERTLGRLKLKRGPAALEIRSLAIPGEELMSLHKVWLRRLEGG
jgi:arylsulfatase A